MPRFVMLAVLALLITACGSSTDKEMAKRSLARNEIGRAYMIYTEYCRVNKKPPLAKADLSSFDSNYPVSVEYYPNGYPDIKSAIFVRPWDNKMMLVGEKGETSILEQCDKL